MARPREIPAPVKRNGYWYLIRRVPPEYAAFENRHRIVSSTNIRITDDPRGIAAQRKVDAMYEELLEFWTAKQEGRTPAPQRQLDRAIATAQMFGVPYIPAKQLVAAGVDVMAQRLMMLKAPEHMENEQAFRALLGGVNAEGRKGTGIKLSKMIEAVEEIQAVKLANKSPNQIRKWRNAKKLALNYFRAAVLNDKTVEDLTGDDVRNYRLRIQERILDEEITIETGNKYITRVGSMFKAIRRHYQLPIENIFSEMTFPGAKSKQRVAFDPEFVQNRILAEGLFDDLNPEARCVIYLMVETGLRPSEACNLLPKAIHLDQKIPYIEILEDDRDVKSEGALRKIPLVGCALMAMQANPSGFPRYLDKEDSLSALLNKAFDARKLFTEDMQTLYSLRHTFKDRLRDIPEAKDEFIDVLMGHTDQGPKYGKGYTLAFKLSVLEKMAFKPPSRV